MIVKIKRIPLYSQQFFFSSPMKDKFLVDIKMMNNSHKSRLALICLLAAMWAFQEFSRNWKYKSTPTEIRQHSKSLSLSDAPSAESALILHTLQHQKSPENFKVSTRSL